MWPLRPEMEPMGVLRLLGNRPNCACGWDDMAEAEREGTTVGEAPDAPETDE
jgi:hypothetical protein